MFTLDAFWPLEIPTAAQILTLCNHADSVTYCNCLRRQLKNKKNNKKKAFLIISGKEAKCRLAETQLSSMLQQE